MSSILDEILAGGAPQAPSADPSAGAGLPPDLLSAIAASAGSAGSQQGSEDDSSSNPSDLISDAIDDLKKFLDVAQDEQDKATVATCLANLQKVLANEQAAADQALQGKVTPQYIRKSAGALGGPGA